MKHRILFAYPEASPLCSSSGIGTFVFEVAHLLAQTGRWDVDILTDLSYGSDGAPADRARAAAGFSAPGITLHDIDRDDGIPCAWGSPVIHRAERFYRAIVRLHAERRYELIECPDYCAPGFFVVRDKRTSGGFANTKLVTHLHGSTSDICEWQRRSFLDREELYANYMESYVKKYADAVISPTEFLLGQSRQTGSTVEREFCRIGYPITSLSDAIARAPRRDASRRIVVACAGRLELRKGQDLLALAIKKLHESGALDQRTDFVFSGSDGLGPERDGRMSRTLARILQGVQNWTIVPAKPRHELQAWLAGAVDICVLSSRSANYPNTALEAARAGCYQVCSNAGGIPELVKDYGLQTLAYHSEDVSMLAEALRQAIRDVQQEPDIRSRLAGNFESQRLHQCRQSVAAYESLADRGASRSTAPTRGKDFPRVSIIIPFYNAHQHARETLRSAFASNYPNFEVILVNDGSTLRESKDFLSSIANEFPELRIVHKPNGGLGDARNAGLQVATGEFVVPLDADNMILPDMVRCCSRLLSERPDLSYVTTYFECLRDEDGVRIPWRLSPIAKPLGAVDPLLLLENTVGDALAMIRRSHIDLVGGYSTHIYCFEDWDLWLKFHERGMEGDVLPEVHFVYRLRETSMSRSVDAIRGVRLQQALMMQHRNLVQQQAIPITTLLLTEYWTKWRNQKPVQREDQPQDTLIKAMGVIRDHPRWSLSFMAEKIFRRAAGRLGRR